MYGFIVRNEQCACNLWCSIDLVVRNSTALIGVSKDISLAATNNTARPTNIIIHSLLFTIKVSVSNRVENS